MNVCNIINKSRKSFMNKNIPFGSNTIK